MTKRVDDEATAVVEAVRIATGEAPLTKGSLHMSGGGDCGWSRTGLLQAGQNSKYFVKLTDDQLYPDLLQSEFYGLCALFLVGSVKVPRPVCCGKLPPPPERQQQTRKSNRIHSKPSPHSSFLVMEHLDLHPSLLYQVANDLGECLANMHCVTSPNGMFGFFINNYIGGTPQRNTWTNSWSDFFDAHRLDPIFRLLQAKGVVFQKESEVRASVRKTLMRHERDHKVIPALVHGDLWTGNISTTTATLPPQSVLYDPCIYFGDREVDVSMTELFGSLPIKTYESYKGSVGGLVVRVMDRVRQEEDEEGSNVKSLLIGNAATQQWKMVDTTESSRTPAWVEEGYEDRKVIYNLYHILNHALLFEGGYVDQARRMIKRIIAAAAPAAGN